MTLVYASRYELENVLNSLYSGGHDRLYIISIKKLEPRFISIKKKIVGIKRLKCSCKVEIAESFVNSNFHLSCLYGTN